jgi:hypothetical protein
MQKCKEPATNANYLRLCNKKGTRLFHEVTHVGIKQNKHPIRFPISDFKLYFKPGNNLKYMLVARIAVICTRIRTDTFMTSASRIPSILSMNYADNLSKNNKDPSISCAQQFIQCIFWIHPKELFIGGRLSKLPNQWNSGIHLNAMNSNADPNTQLNNRNIYKHNTSPTTKTHYKKYKPILECLDLRKIWINENPSSVNHILNRYVVCHKHRTNN